MGPTVTTEHAEIVAALDRYLAADPVAGTVLGTIRATLEDSAWAAVGDGRLAVRSSADFPVALAGDWSAAAVGELAPLLRALPDLRSVVGPRPVVEALLPQLPRHSVAVRMGQGLFRCDRLVAPADVPGRPVAATDADRALVRAWFAAFAAEADAIVRHTDAAADRLMAAGVCWLWRDDAGEPVSMAARRDPVAGSARVGPVYTPPAARGHGYGSAVTARATRDVLELDAIPVLFTDLANPTSNKIYRQLGYVPVEQRLLVSFR